MQLGPSMAIEHSATQLGQLTSHLSPHSFDARNAQLIVGCGVVTEPGNHCGFGALGDGNPLGPRDGATPDGGCQLGHLGRQRFGQRSIRCCEAEKQPDLLGKGIHVRGLGSLAAGLVALSLFGVAIGGPFSFQGGAGCRDLLAWCPQSL